MPTVITSTLKPSGGDYTTVAAWLAANGGATSQDLVANDEAIVLEIHNGDYTGIGNGGDGFIAENIAPSGWTTDATRNITVKVVEGRHNGVPGSGFEWRNSGDTNTPLVLNNNSDWVLEGIHFKATTTQTYVEVVSIGTDCFVYNCIFEHASTGVVEAVRVNGRGSKFFSCLMIATASGADFGVEVASFNNAEFYNCAFVGFATAGVDSGPGTATYPTKLVNCYSLDCPELANSGATQYFTDDSSHNASDVPGDATVPGTTPFKGVIGKDNFADAANDDYNLNPWSHLIAAGSDVGEQFSQDISGAVIRNDAWPIGPFFALPHTEQGAALPNKRLFAPELLIPNRKPAGAMPVKIDWSHPLTEGLRHCFFCGPNSWIDLANQGAAIWPIDATVGTPTHRPALGENAFGFISSGVAFTIPEIGGDLNRGVSVFCRTFASQTNATDMPFTLSRIDGSGNNMRCGAYFHDGGGFRAECTDDSGNADVRLLSSNTLQVANRWFNLGFAVKSGDSSFVVDGTPDLMNETDAISPQLPLFNRVSIGGWYRNAGWNSTLTGGVSLGYVWDHRISDGALLSITKDPYQFLEPA